MKYLFLLISLLLYTTGSRAIEPTDSLYVAEVSGLFEKVISAPQEKIYLHTDKPYYFAGDTIWIKGYQVNAISHFPDYGSRYLYVELVNRKDRLVKRLKLEKEDNAYLGYLPLVKDMEEGDYYLRAYTRWMQNIDPDYYFSRNLRIIASQAAFMTPLIRYEQTGKGRMATITFRKTGGEPYSGHYVRYMVRTDEVGNSFREQKTNEQGEIRIEIPEKKALEQYIYVSLEDRILEHKHTFYVPAAFDYQVDFFPEGGNLIADQTQKVGFKAIDTEGHSVNVNGFILNQSGDTLTRFESQHAGIGSLQLSTSSGDQYHAMVYTSQGLTKKFDLPLPERDKCALTVTARNDVLRYRVLEGSSASGTGTKPYYLVAHIRGLVLFIQKLETPEGAISLAGLPEGILTLMLLDENYLPHSERLFFLRNHTCDWKVIPDKVNDEPRSLVKLDISLKDKEGDALSGDFSLSVTENRSVAIDPVGGNILSHLLLTSDLEGYIESPGYYFRDESARTLACLDNLMLTQGWSRFNLQELMKKKQEEPEFLMEMEQVVSGYVSNYLGKPDSNRGVSISVNQRLVNSVKTDAKGRFVVLRENRSDKDVISARLLGDVGIVKPKITIDRDRFPVLSNKIPYQSDIYHTDQEKYIESLQSPYVMEDGIMVVRLPELVINAQHIIKERFSSYKVSDEEVMAQKKAKTALQLVKEINGVQIISNRLYINPSHSMAPRMSMKADRNKQNRNAVRFITRTQGSSPGPRSGSNPAIIYLDDRRIPFSELSQIDASEIKAVYKIDPEVYDALSGLRIGDLEREYLRMMESGGDFEEMEETLFKLGTSERFLDSTRPISGGSVSLVSKSGNYVRNSMDSRIDNVSLKSIDKYRRKYQPRYETLRQKTSPVPDNRTTIHWEPRLKLNEQGKGVIRFYTTDTPGDYSITVEGVTDKGIPCSYKYSYNPEE